MITLFEKLFSKKSPSQQETVSPDQSFSIQFSFTKPRVIGAGLILVLSFCLLRFQPDICHEVTEAGTSQLSLPALFTILGITLAAALLLLLKLRLPSVPARIINGFLLFFTPLLCLFGVEWLHESYLITRRVPLRWVANYLCYLLIFSLFHAIFRKVRVTQVAGSVLCVGFGLINYFIIQFRGVPILPWDIKSIGTALSVAESYSLTVSFRPAVVFLSLLLLLSLLHLLPAATSAAVTPKQRWGERGIAAGICVVLFTLLLPMNILPSLNVNVWPWNQKASTRMTGVMAGFVGNLQFVMVEKPDHYSSKEAENTLDELQHEDATPALGNPAKPPTIIAIMNESLADLETSARGNLTLSEDAMPFLHELMSSDRTYSGTAYSSVFGGSTCDSEFEFLTGNSLSFLPAGSKPYQQYIDKELPSLATTLSDNGYDTVAIHPGRAEAWHRNKVYPLLGFDRFLAAADFTVPREVERAYTSDRSCYDQVIQEYEQSKQTGVPKFIFNVTIQNHGGYQEEDYPSTIFVENAPGSYPDLEQYLTLIQQTDRAFEELIAYFQNEQEPVVILLYGDHWPAIGSDTLNMLLGVEDTMHLGAQENLYQYEVPFLIWANYPIQSASDQQVSFNQLSGLLSRAAGIDLTPYQEFITDFSKQVPVLTGMGMIDENGTAYLRGDDSGYEALLNEYAILQYNQMFDKDGTVEELFSSSASE